jgi:hypothetical protein
MIVLNFSHPLTHEHLTQIETFAEKRIERVLEFKVHFENEYPFRPQLDELMKQVVLTSNEWETKSILVNLPSLNFIAALVLAEIHGRMGHFPRILRIRPVRDTYEVAEILDLRNVRETARQERK